MKKTVPSKAETDLLEPFPGLPLERIYVPTTTEHFAFALADIKAAGTVGFDTEARPTLLVGEVSDGPHIVQFATQERAYIFQLSVPGCRPYLVELLSSAAVRKVGFDLQSDREQIRAKLGVTMAGVLDLIAVFRKMGYTNAMGVRGAVGIVLNQRFHKSKKVTTSNWSLPHLNEKQLVYAANDAYAALKVLDGLNRQGAGL